MSSSPSYLDPIVLPLIIGETVLDVGCGYGRWGNLIQSNYWEAGLARPPFIDGCDAFLPNVELSARHNAYRKIWQQVLPSPVSERWDTILACEIIEHIEQDKVEETIEILEQAAKKRIIISTPNWPYYRAGGDTIVGYNEYEAHVSYLPRSYFRQRGYQLIGAGWGNPTHLMVRACRKLNLPLQGIFQSLPRAFPALGESLVVYKDVG
jgi:SAM-dependent methyltransferase